VHRQGDAYGLIGGEGSNTCADERYNLCYLACGERRS